MYLYILKLIIIMLVILAATLQIKYKPDILSNLCIYKLSCNKNTLDILSNVYMF